MDTTSARDGNGNPSYDHQKQASDDLKNRSHTPSVPLSLSQEQEKAVTMAKDRVFQVSGPLLTIDTRVMHIKLLHILTCMSRRLKVGQTALLRGLTHSVGQ
jgi:hypothetical protein